MLRAVYDFEPPQASYENTLKFTEKDLFIVLKRDKSIQDWVHVVNLQGENGYVSESVFFLFKRLKEKTFLYFL